MWVWRGLLALVWYLLSLAIHRQRIVTAAHTQAQPSVIKTPTKSYLHTRARTQVQREYLRQRGSKGAREECVACVGTVMQRVVQRLLLLAHDVL